MSRLESDLGVPGKRVEGLSRSAPRRTRYAKVLRRMGWAGVTSAVIALMLVVVAFLAPCFTPRDPFALNLRNRLAPPSAEHWFGTDEAGRDVFSRVILGSRISLGVAGVALLLAVSLGILIGTVAGYSGGLVDDILMRITDLFLAVPTMILAMAIAATLGPSTWNSGVAIALAWWPQYARLVRGQVLATKHADYVEAAKAIGASDWWIAVRHILPNSFDPVVIRMTLDVGHAILITASLSFIGLGTQPPTPDWGTMIATARPYIMMAPWYPTVVGLAIFVTVVAFSMAGDALQDALVKSGE